jgi:hypothetical protein
VSDETSSATPETPKKGGRYKTFLGTIAGLLSGAFMMYVSPLLSKVVQPSRPLANFGVEYNGLTVTFYNRSSGGSEGWLDFGDGTPLEPVSAKQTTITHTYANAETYYAKLTWRSLLGDENERSVKIELDSQNQKKEPPVIVSLEATPVTPGAFAPATFRIVCKTKNAKLCVWDIGDDRSLQFSTETPDSQDRLVTFDKAGGYVVRVAAVNGDQGVEKSTIVSVDEPPPGCITAIVTVTDQATRVEKFESYVNVSKGFPPHTKDDTYRFDEAVPPTRQGFQITDARMEVVNDQGVRNLELNIAPDRQSVHVTGELFRQTGLLTRIKGNASPPNMLVRVHMTQERQILEKRAPVSASGTLNVPGNVLMALPPLPDGWINPQRQLTLQVRDCERVAWQGPQLPRGAPVTVQNKSCSLTATPVGNQLRVELTEVKPGT